MKLTLRLAAALLAMATTAIWTLPVNAATNAAADGGGPVSLTASGNVTVTSAALQLVKQVYDTSGNCLASSPADASCNASATTVIVPAGTALKFLIFVRNTTDVAITDVRFSDALDTSGSGFTYSAGTMKYNAADADNETIANLYTNTNGGTAQTDIVGGPDDFASFVSPNFTVGAVAGQVNNTVNLPAHKTFALIFTASKI